MKKRLLNILNSSQKVQFSMFISKHVLLKKKLFFNRLLASSNYSDAVEEIETSSPFVCFIVTLILPSEGGRIIYAPGSMQPDPGDDLFIDENSRLVVPV